MFFLFVFLFVFCCFAGYAQYHGRGFFVVFGPVLRCECVCVRGCATRTDRHTHTHIHAHTHTHTHTRTHTHKIGWRGALGCFPLFLHPGLAFDFLRFPLFLLYFFSLFFSPLHKQTWRRMFPFCISVFPLCVLLLQIAQAEG